MAFSQEKQSPSHIYYSIFNKFSKFIFCEYLISFLFDCLKQSNVTSSSNEALSQAWTKLEPTFSQAWFQLNTRSNWFQLDLRLSSWLIRLYQIINKLSLIWNLKLIKYFKQSMIRAQLNQVAVSIIITSRESSWQTTGAVLWQLMNKKILKIIDTWWWRSGWNYWEFTHWLVPYSSNGIIAWMLSV